jgi:hypothetical protein
MSKTPNDPRPELVPEPSGFVRADRGKPRLDLVPPEAIIGLADVLTFGADKYAPRNWELGGAWGRSYASAMRHLMAFWSGEDIDPETGLPHIDHALTNIVFLSTYQKRNIGTDDRHKVAGK